MHSFSFASVLSSSTENSNAAYPTLFRIAMDYLPIQASSVPCERVFSGSGETDTNRRSCTSPQLTGVLQVIKFARKKARLDFSFQYLTTAAQLESILHDVQKTKASLTPEAFSNTYRVIKSVI